MEQHRLDSGLSAVGFTSECIEGQRAGRRASPSATGRRTWHLPAKSIDVDELVAGLANGVGGKIVEDIDHEKNPRGSLD